MQSDDQTRVFEARGARQAAAFANALRVRALMACAIEERSISQLQRQFDVPLAKLHYHVGRLIAAKLLSVSRIQSRAGRGIKFYRAVARSFLVPQEILPELPSERWSVQLRRSLSDEQSRVGELSLLYTAAAGGKVMVKVVRPESEVQTRGMEIWRTIKLSPNQRKSLANELGELLERYAAADAEIGGEMFLVHAAFAPSQSHG